MEKRKSVRKDVFLDRNFFRGDTNSYYGIWIDDVCIGLHSVYSNEVYFTHIEGEDSKIKINIEEIGFIKHVYFL